MEDEILLLFYLTIFVVEIILLVKSIKNQNKKLWGTLIILEIFSVVVSVILYNYYEGLPGYGFMPGFTYFGEILVSFGMAIIYSITFFITICIMICKRKLRHDSLKNKDKKY